MKLTYGLKSIIEKTVYSAGKLAYGIGAQKYFDIKINGKDNLPESSAVLAFNHTFGLDGIFTCTSIPRQIHQLIQFEGVYNRNLYRTLGLWSFGFIPVSVGGISETGMIDETSINKQMNLRAIKRSIDYLKSYDDFVGIFIDGPANRLIDQNGKPLPKSQRKSSESAATIALNSGKPIVPIGLWMPENLAERLWEFGYDKQKENMNYLKSRKIQLADRGENYLIPYQINIGKPIDPKNIEGKNSEKRKMLTEIVRSEIIRLSERN